MSEMITINTESIVEKKLDPLPIYGENYAGLRIPIKEYDVSLLPNAEMYNLVKQLKMTMKLYNGIGLSANQCGINRRVFVIGTDQFQIACINPKIISRSEEDEKQREGCLSFPGLFVPVKRSKSIDVEYYDENGLLRSVHMEGITAQCFQHELDHMNGVVFIEHVGEVTIRLARQKQQKFIKNIKRKMK